MPDHLHGNAVTEKDLAVLDERSKHQNVAINEINAKLDGIDKRLRSIEDWRNRLFGVGIAFSIAVSIGALTVGIVALFV